MTTVLGWMGEGTATSCLRRDHLVDRPKLSWSPRPAAKHLIKIQSSLSFMAHLADVVD